MGDLTEFPAAAGRAAPRSLAAAGITTYAQLAEHTERELLAIHGVGPKAIRILAAKMQKHGLSFRAG